MKINVYLEVNLYLCTVNKIISCQILSHITSKSLTNPFQVDITTALPINYVCTYMKLQPKIRLGCKMWKCDVFIEVVDDLRLVVKNLENRIIALESGSRGGAKPQVTIVTAISFWHEFIPYHTCIILQSYGSHFMYAHTITYKWT